MYSVYVCSKFSKTDQIEIRRKRLDYLLENALENDTPVIIHLYSGIYGYGHYITLIGYDKAKGGGASVAPFRLKVYYQASIEKIWSFSLI